MIAKLFVSCVLLHLILVEQLIYQDFSLSETEPRILEQIIDQHFTSLQLELRGHEEFFLVCAHRQVKLGVPIAVLDLRTALLLAHILDELVVLGLVSELNLVRQETQVIDYLLDCLAVIFDEGLLLHLVPRKGDGLILAENLRLIDVMHLMRELLIVLQELVAQVCTVLVVADAVLSLLHCDLLLDLEQVIVVLDVFRGAAGDQLIVLHYFHLVSSRNQVFCRTHAAARTLSLSFIQTEEVIVCELRHVAHAAKLVLADLDVGVDLVLQRLLVAEQLLQEQPLAARVWHLLTYLELLR